MEKASLIGGALGFGVLGFVIAARAGAGWGVGVGALGFVCYMLGWAFGWASAHDSR